MLAHCVAVLLAAGSSPDAGAEGLAQQHHAQAVELIESGDFERSKALLEQAAREYRAAGPAFEFEALGSENDLATSYRRHGEPALAVSLLQRVTAALPKAAALPADRLTLQRVVLNNLGAALLDARQYAEAHRTWDSLFALTKRLPIDEETARALDNQANLYLIEEKLPQAEKYFRLGNAAWLELRGKDSLDYAISRIGLGTVFERSKRLSEARVMITEALAATERLLGPSHPDVGGVLNLLADVEIDSGNLDAAEKLLRRSLTISEAKLAPNHSQIVTARNSLAFIEAQRKAAH